MRKFMCIIALCAMLTAGCAPSAITDQAMVSPSLPLTSAIQTDAASLIEPIDSGFFDDEDQDIHSRDAVGGTMNNGRTENERTQAGSDVKTNDVTNPTASRKVQNTPKRSVATPRSTHPKPSHTPEVSQPATAAPAIASDAPVPIASASEPIGSSTPSVSELKPTNSKLKCTVAIDCLTALAVKPSLANAVSTKGYILKETTISLVNGASVYDTLAASGVQFSGTPGYVTSINSLGEGDCGPGSGWMYSVNGVFPKSGSNSYKLKEGDKVAWRYTCNTGKDIGAEY